MKTKTSVGGDSLFGLSDPICRSRFIARSLEYRRGEEFLSLLQMGFDLCEDPSINGLKPIFDMVECHINTETYRAF